MLSEPLVPAGTSAALASTNPWSAFGVDTTGRACPVGHAVRQPSGPDGCTVTFNKYAPALSGKPQGLLAIGNVRMVLASIMGPPKRPFVPRVSMIRQGRHRLEVQAACAGAK